MRALSAGVCALCAGELMCGEMPPEPVARQHGYPLERTRLFEQMRRPWHDLNACLSAQRVERPPIELQDLWIVSAHDQQGRRGDAQQCVAGEIGAPAAGDHGADARPHGVGVPGNRYSGAARLKAYTARPIRIEANDALPGTLDGNAPVPVGCQLRSRLRSESGCECETARSYGYPRSSNTDGLAHESWCPQFGVTRSRRPAARPGWACSGRLRRLSVSRLAGILAAHEVSEQRCGVGVHPLAHAVYVIALQEPVDALLRGVGVAALELEREP